jgi:aminoglycoside phosphotransferase (APT) family kinase protein
VIVSPAKRSPAYLAALASAAVPGLDPASVRALRPGRTGEFDAALVIDTQDRSWVIRAPRTPAAGARLESAAALVALLARRLPFQVPVPRGFASIPEGRAAVYPLLPGRPLAFDALPSGPGLAAELGKAIAAIHNLDRGVFEEAGVPAYDADSYRTRRLADLDRAAATGHVPVTLLSRWESALDDVTLWRFAPAPVHGGITGSQVLAVFDSDADAASGHVRGVVGWEDAKIADPAEDFAAIVTRAVPGAVESVLEAYANTRIERPDPHLRRRATLAAELGVLADLLGAVTLGEPERVRLMAGRITDLAGRVSEDDLKAADPVQLVPRDVATAAPASAPTRAAGTPAGAGADGRSAGTVTAPAPAAAGATDVTALPTEPMAIGEDTVAMDPRMIFDATEEIPQEQLAKARAHPVTSSSAATDATDSTDATDTPAATDTTPPASADTGPDTA